MASMVQQVEQSNREWSNLMLDYFLPMEKFHHILYNRHFTIKDLSRFDVAVGNKNKRPVFSTTSRSNSCLWPGNENKARFSSPQEMSWISDRNIKIKQISCNVVTGTLANRIASFGSTLQTLWIKSISDGDLIVDMCADMVDLNISGCKIGDSSVVKIGGKCPKLA